MKNDGSCIPLISRLDTKSLRARLQADLYLVFVYKQVLKIPVKKLISPG
jgi:hypothetical protein